jgi:crotonobetaine/carnitine-CoA ligase
MTKDAWSSGEPRTILDLLDRRLATDPDGAYLDACGTRFTAAELDARSNQLANGLADLGVHKGDRVAALLDNGPEAVLTWFATVKLGAVAVPVNTAHKGGYLQRQLVDADPRVLVVQEDLADRADGALEGVESLAHVAYTGTALERPKGTRGTPRRCLLRDICCGSEARPAASIDPADLGTLIYTGGTTGPSKGCALSHNYHPAIAHQNALAWGRTPEDVVWTPLPLFHFNALEIILVGTLLVGGRASIARRFSVSRFWAQQNEAGTTIASLLGSLAVLVARDEDRPEQPLSGRPEANTTVRLVTGAPMPPEIDAIYRERFGIPTFSAAYGVTEASLLSWLPPGARNKPGAAGVVNGEYFDVRIFGEDDGELPRGEEGEIVCRPRKPHVMFEGYWRRPDATLAASRNWWFHTGDVGRIDEDGYLFFVDRKADYVRRRGENVSTWEVEQAFHLHDCVEDVAVHAVPSSLGEDDIKATVVLKTGTSLNEEQLFRWAVDRLPYFALPRYIEFRRDLPRNETGRVTKSRLREEGVTERTWDRDEAGVSFERR